MQSESKPSDSKRTWIIVGAIVVAAVFAVLACGGLVLLLLLAWQARSLEPLPEQAPPPVIERQR